MQKNLPILRNMILIVTAAIFIGFILMMLAYSLPNDRVYRNVQRSLHIYQVENDAPYWGELIQTRLDNFTDSIMLMKAAYPVEENILQAALLNPSWKLEDNLPVKTVINVFTDNIKSTSDTWIYPRYWHGYLVVLKPILMTSRLQTLRILNFYLQFLLIILTSILIFQRLGKFYVIAFALTLMLINPVTTALNLQNSTTLYVTLLSMIFILLKNDFLRRGANYIYFFLLVGIVEVYVDFLTYPLVSLGVPLCLFIVLNKDLFLKVSLKTAAEKIFACSFAWGFGYSLMWIGKWILATILTGRNVIYESLGEAIYRTSSQLSATEGGQTFTFFEVIYRNINDLTRDSFKVFLDIFILYMIFKMIRSHAKIFHNKVLFGVFGFIILMPFVWYAVLSNHSYLHDFLAYRELAVAMFGFSCLLIEMSENK